MSLLFLPINKAITSSPNAPLVLVKRDRVWWHKEQISFSSPLQISQQQQKKSDSDGDSNPALSSCSLIDHSPNFFSQSPSPRLRSDFLLTGFIPMALQSPGATGASSSVSRLLLSAKLTSSKSLFSSVDFLGSSSYSITSTGRRIKRRNELSAFRGFTPLLKSSLRSPLSAKAGASSASFSDLKPEVIGRFYAIMLI